MEIFKSTDQFDMNTFNSKLGGALAETVPTGLIAMWSGAVNAIPKGWVLCNGENNTPDLRNRFIVGAGNEYSVGDVGGTAIYELGTQLSGTKPPDVNGFPGDPLPTSMDNRPPYYALCYIMKQ